MYTNRVEKYKDYREEISKNDNSSSKSNIVNSTPNIVKETKVLSQLELKQRKQLIRTLVLSSALGIALLAVVITLIVIICK